MCKAIIFDFGNVIFKFDHATFLEKLTEYCDKSKKELKKIIYDKSELHVLYDTGILTSEEFHKKVVQLTGAKISKSELRKIYGHIFTEVRGTQDMIKILKTKYKIGLLSNTSEWHYDDFISKIDVIDLFDAQTLSYKVGAMKPDKTIFEDMIRKLGLPPEECIFIDDIPEFVEAAKKIGMRGIVFKTLKQVKEELGYKILT